MFIWIKNSLQKSRGIDSNISFTLIINQNIGKTNIIKTNTSRSLLFSSWAAHHPLEASTHWWKKAFASETSSRQIFWTLTII